MGKAVTSPFAGADIKIGPVSITGKHKASDFKLNEIIYIVARYIIQHAENNEFHGSVGKAINDLWPYDSAKFNSAIKSKIYQGLHINGFKYEPSRGDSIGYGFWRVPNNTDLQFQKEPTYDHIVIRDIDEKPVTYRCGFCKKTFKDRESLKDHLVIERKEQEMAAVIEAKKAEEAKRDTKCPECGKMVTKRGLSPHLRAHQFSRADKELLTAIMQMDGEHARDYAVVLGASSSAIAARATRLKERGYITQTGHTVSSRYHLNEKAVPKALFAELKAGKKEEKKESPIRRRATPKPVADNGGFTFARASVISMNGKYLIVTDDGEAIEVLSSRPAR